MTPRHLLDLGTGSGCLLLALLSEWKDTQGVGIDTSAGAIAVAKRNSVQLGLDFRSEFLGESWEEHSPTNCHVILANPPYISEGDWQQLAPVVRDFEPRTVLEAGEDGLDAIRSLWSAFDRWQHRGSIDVGSSR